MKKKNGVNHSLQLAVQNRRKSVINRLEAQLLSGVKPLGDIMVSLKKSDIERINKELLTLKSRV